MSNIPPPVSTTQISAARVIPVCRRALSEVSAASEALLQRAIRLYATKNALSRDADSLRREVLARNDWLDDDSRAKLLSRRIAAERLLALAEASESGYVNLTLADLESLRSLEV